MTYNFTFRGKQHSLDTIAGTLTGALADELRQLIDRSIGRTTGGHPSSPFDCVKIVTPYHDIGQFTMSLAESLPVDFPVELGKFVKIYSIDTTNVPFEVTY